MAQQAPAFISLSPEELETNLPTYDNIELLAVGGMGSVYKARQISLDRPVAIKTLTHAHVSSLQFRQIFKQEARTMAKLNHPSIASIYDYGEINGILYIVMQFIEGRSLFQLSHGKEVAHKEAASLICKVADALTKTHQAGILHRDIKPANIIIDKEATPVLIDFGLAHHAEETTLKGESIFGSDHYTAPEVTSPPYQADQRSDLFALGVLFYEMLTGKVPGVPYFPPSEIAKVDRRYDDFVKQAISPDPDHRLPTAQELSKQLRHISDHPPSSSKLEENENYQSYPQTSIIPHGYEHSEAQPVSENTTVLAPSRREKKQFPFLLVLTLVGITIAILTIVFAQRKFLMLD